MIRIDYKVDGEYIKTTWVKENPDSHTLMGRLIFTADDWGRFIILQANNKDLIFEKKD